MTVRSWGTVSRDPSHCLMLQLPLKSLLRCRGIGATQKANTRYLSVRGSRDCGFAFDLQASGWFLNPKHEFSYLAGFCYPSLLVQAVWHRVRGSCTSSLLGIPCFPEGLPQGWTCSASGSMKNDLETIYPFLCNLQVGVVHFNSRQYVV